MIKTLESQTIDVHLFVNEEPREEKREWSVKDQEGKETGEKRSMRVNYISGLLITSNLLPGAEPKKMKISINPDGGKDFPSMREVDRSFLRHEEDLMKGRKYIQAKVYLAEKAFTRGEDKNKIYGWEPVLADMQVVEAKEEDRMFIKKFQD